MVFTEGGLQDSIFIRICVFIQVSAGPATLMERLIHTDWLEITPCEVGSDKWAGYNKLW